MRSKLVFDFFASTETSPFRISVLCSTRKSLYQHHLPQPLPRSALESTSATTVAVRASAELHSSKHPRPSTRTPKGMLFGWFYVTKNLQKAFLWGSGHFLRLSFSVTFDFLLCLLIPCPSLFISFASAKKKTPRFTMQWGVRLANIQTTKLTEEHTSPCEAPKSTERSPLVFVGIDPASESHEKLGRSNKLQSHHLTIGSRICLEPNCCTKIIQKSPRK